jgi:hypothetical protein
MHFLRTRNVLAGVVLLLSAGHSPAAAQQAPSIGGGWQPGPDAVGDSTYSGFIDTPAAGANVTTGGSVLVAGWFVDTTADGWAGADDVQVFSGDMSAGGTLLGKGVVGQSRPDVAAALNNGFWSSAGWSASVTAPPGSAPLWVYVHTPAKGWWFKQVTVNATAAPLVPGGSPASQPTVARPGGPPVNVIVEPRAAENLGTETDFEMRGYALDPAAAPNQGSQGTGIDQVQIYLNAPRGDPSTTVLGNAKLAYSDGTAAAQYGPQFAAAGWRMSLHTTGFHANAYTLYVYAHSAVTGQESLTRVGFQIVEGRV